MVGAQVVNLHYMLSKAVVKARPSVLWCYKKDLFLSRYVVFRYSLGLDPRRDISTKMNFFYNLCTSDEMGQWGFTQDCSVLFS